MLNLFYCFFFFSMSVGSSFVLICFVLIRLHYFLLYSVLFFVFIFFAFLFSFIFSFLPLPFSFYSLSSSLVPLSHSRSLLSFFLLSLFLSFLNIRAFWAHITLTLGCTQCTHGKYTSFFINKDDDHGQASLSIFRLGT